MPEELWMEIYSIVQEAVIKTIPKEKKFKKAKWLSEEALQTAEERREVKGKGEKERYMFYFCFVFWLFLMFGFLAAKHVGSWLPIRD